MKNAFLTAITAVVAIMVTGNVKAQSPATLHYSKADLKQMVRVAHTPEEYQALAEYFRSQQTVYKLRARAELVEWDRRSQFVTGLAAKYPRPVDSSRNRYEYFAYEARQMSRQAEHFESLLTKTQ